MTQKENKILYSDCCQYALNYISRYPKTEKELKIKLLQKGYNSEEVAETMDYLKTKKFADDRIFTESYVRSELVNKGKPQIVVVNKLYQKGVDKVLINEVLSQYEEDVSLGIFAKIRKEIDNYKRKGIDGFDIIQKLMRKGYRLDDIKFVITSDK